MQNPPIRYTAPWHKRPGRVVTPGSSKAIIYNPYKIGCPRGTIGRTPTCVRPSFVAVLRCCAVLSASVPGVSENPRSAREGGEAGQPPSDRVQIQWDNMIVGGAPVGAVAHARRALRVVVHVDLARRERSAQPGGPELVGRRSAYTVCASRRRPGRRERPRGVRSTT